MLKIQLLGGFSVKSNGRESSALTRPRARSLLAWLLLAHGSQVDRNRLAAVFWPDSDEAHARSSLRREVHRLRAVDPLIEAHLDGDRNSVVWRMPARYQLDVEVFRRLATLSTNVADATDATDAIRKAQSTRAAVAAYTGDLLPGDSDPWVLDVREDLHRTWRQLIESLADLTENEGAAQEAIELNTTLIRTDPLDESAYLRLMRLFAAHDDRARALHVYHGCASVLESELGIEPCEALRALYLDLRAHTGVTPVGPVRVAPAHRASQPSLIGRDEPLAELRRAWVDLPTAGSALHLIEGEPGIGKTRLADTFLAEIALTATMVARARAYAAEGSLPFSPVKDWLRTQGIIERASQIDGTSAVELLRVFPDLFAKRSQSAPVPRIEADSRLRLFEAMARAVVDPDRPTVLLLDDLQWCDSDTLEWLRYLMRLEKKRSLLVLATLRSEEVGPRHPVNALISTLAGNDQIHRTMLAALDLDSTRAMVVQELQATDACDCSALDAQEVYRLSDGIPLFIREFVHWHRERDHTLADPLMGDRSHLPPRVRAVIEHRLAPLSPQAIQVARSAATIGKVFTAAFLIQMHPDSPEAVIAALDEMWRRRLIGERPDGAYDFTHDCIREVAYAQMSPIRARQMHALVAREMSNAQAVSLDAVSGELARHFERAGDHPNAIQWYRHAADVADRLTAWREAIASRSAALRLIEANDRVPEMFEDRAVLLYQICEAWVALDGFSSPHIEAISGQLEAMIPRLDLGQARFRLLTRLRMFHANSQRLPRARFYARRMLELTRKTGVPAGLIESYRAVGLNHFQMGEIQASDDACANAARVASQAIESGAIDTANPPWSLPAMWRTWANFLYVKGEFTRARATHKRAIAIPITAFPPPDLFYLLFFDLIHYYYRGQPREVLVRAQALRRLGEEHDLMQARLFGSFYCAWARGERGDPGAEVSAMVAVLGQFDAARFTMHQCQLRGMLAHHQLAASQIDAAVRTIAKGLALAECFWDAELHRLGAEAMVLQGKPAAAVLGRFDKAIEIATAQSAGMFILRAGTSRARWLAQTGEIEPARQAIDAVLRQHGRRGHSADLAAARLLLQQLSTSN